MFPGRGMVGAELLHDHIVHAVYMPGANVCGGIVRLMRRELPYVVLLLFSVAKLTSNIPLEFVEYTHCRTRGHRVKTL